MALCQASRLEKHVDHSMWQGAELPKSLLAGAGPECGAGAPPVRGEKGGQLQGWPGQEGLPALPSAERVLDPPLYSFRDTPCPLTLVLLGTLYLSHNVFLTVCYSALF